jgi:hypothetical protein
MPIKDRLGHGLDDRFIARLQGPGFYPLNEGTQFLGLDLDVRGRISSINVTMDTYGHLMKTVNKESARRLDKAIFKQNGDFLETYERGEQEGVVLSA